MTTFAIFYKSADLQALAAQATNPGLTGQERNEINRYWNAGLRDWQTAPQAPEQYRCVDIPFEPVPGQIDPDKTWTQNANGSWHVCDPTMRVVVMSSNQVSKDGLINWLRTIGNKYPAALYMLAIADDIALTAVEPYSG